MSTVEFYDASTLLIYSNHDAFNTSISFHCWTLKIKLRWMESREKASVAIYRHEMWFQSLWSKFQWSRIVRGKNEKLLQRDDLIKLLSSDVNEIKIGVDERKAFPFPILPTSHLAIGSCSWYVTQSNEIKNSIFASYALWDVPSILAFKVSQNFIAAYTDKSINSLSSAGRFAMKRSFKSRTCIIFCVALSPFTHRQHEDLCFQNA